MGQLKKWISEEEFEDDDLTHPNKWWNANTGRMIYIESMELQQLENIVNYFSQEGKVVNPMRRGAFENVMLTYLRKKTEVEQT